MGGSIFKHDGILGGIVPGFMWDPYRVTLELSRDPNCNHISILKGSQEHLDSSQWDEIWVILSVKYHFSWQGDASVAECLYM